MESAYVGHTPGPLENQILPSVSQDDLFKALEAKLG